MFFTIFVSFETPVFVWRHRVQSHQKLPRSDEAPHENGCCYCASRRDPSVGPSCGCRFPGTQAVRVWRICRTGRISSNNQKAGWDSPHRPTDLVGQIHRTPQNSPMVNSMVFWYKMQRTQLIPLPKHVGRGGHILTGIPNKTEDGDPTCHVAVVWKLRSCSCHGWNSNLWQIKSSDPPW